MFIDYALIHCASGAGGNGYIGFHRTRSEPNGGPDGGDGGDGGSIIFVADTSHNTLANFRHKRRYKAQDGVKGQGQLKSGKRGENLVIRVPVGTLIKEKETGKLVVDMHTPNEQVTLIRGGKGGRGNKHFATPSRRAPKFAEEGKPGFKIDLILELKVLADVGIIGFPNAGKSTLLAMLTAAKPKIAGYEFTTLSPNLGVASYDWGGGQVFEFVLADIPGLIEGAADGVGLGHDFLKHIERARLLAHIVDVSEADPVARIKSINSELSRYSVALSERPQIIVANKLDLLNEDDERISQVQEFCVQNSYEFFKISGATGLGLKELSRGMAKFLQNAPAPPVFNSEVFEQGNFGYERETSNEIKITKENGIYFIEGTGVDKLLGYTSMQDEKSVAAFHKYLKQHGVIERLREMGVKEGDTVRIYEYEFEFIL